MPKHAPPSPTRPPSRCDVLVVGGGVNGVGIARDLAGRGLEVVLCEREDLAQHTSSASTKLIHGGLRYLEYYEFALVRKALAEREGLLRGAPHITRPLRIVMPHDPSMRPAWMLRIGLFLYDHLAQRGATILTRCGCTEARRDDKGWSATLQSADGSSHGLRARALVNATGPWAESFLREQAALKHVKSLRLVKGSHIVVPQLFDHDRAYIFQNPDKRIIFVQPYEERFTLIGTTDVDCSGPAEAAHIDGDEITYLCDQVNRYFERPIRPSDVVWSYSGVRPLLDDESSDAAAVTRDYLLELDTRGGAPLLNVWGGKLTTFRLLGEEAADLLGPLLGGLAPAWTHGATLPGGDLGAFIKRTGRPDTDLKRFTEAMGARHPTLPAALLRRWARLYGTHIESLIDDGLGAEVAPGVHECELRYLVEHEWARDADDILWRRTKLGLHLDAAQRERVAQWCAGHVGTAASAMVEAPWS